MNILVGIINLFRFDKTNWKAVALCLMAATVFWFFNALNKEHTATISFPVEFSYDQAGFISVKPLPANVLLNITGSGWDLLRKSLGFKVVPLLIALETPNETHKISPTTINTLASKQFGQTKVNHTASDTLQLSIEAKKKRKIKLYINPSHIRFELGFGISSPLIITPDSVLIEGPASIIAQISDSLLLPFPQGRTANNINLELEIVSDLSPILLSHSSAKVWFEVSELTDIKKKIKVIVVPSPPFQHQVSTDSILVTLRLPINRKHEIANALGLFAVVDLQTIEPGVTKILPSIKGLSSFSEIIASDSVTIRKY